MGAMVKQSFVLFFPATRQNKKIESLPFAAALLRSPNLTDFAFSREMTALTLGKPQNFPSYRQTF
jgi:hypothetical protein